MLEPVNAPGTARGLSLDVDPNPPVISNMNRNVTLGPRNYPVRGLDSVRAAPRNRYGVYRVVSRVRTTDAHTWTRPAPVSGCCRPK